MSTRARLQPRAMPPAVLDLKNRLASADRRYAGRFALAAIHLAAFGILLWSEDEPSAQAAFVLTWAALNFFWLVLLRRPLTAAALSLALIVILIALSQFKHSTLMMTATFVDVMLIDAAQFLFYIMANPAPFGNLALAVALALPVMALLWRAEPFRVRRGTALLGCLLCLAALAGLSLAVATDREDEFYPHQYVSKFARSAAVAAADLTNGGGFEGDPATADRLDLGIVGAGPPGRQLAHIVLVVVRA